MDVILYGMVRNMIFMKIQTLITLFRLKGIGLLKSNQDY